MARKENPTTRFYEINPGKSGYARIWITDDGCLTCITDWGNYGYWWGAPGCEFRSFLASCDNDYLATKLSGGEREFAGQETVLLVQEKILSMRRHYDLTREQARSEWELLPTCFDSEIEFNDWLHRTKIPDAWDMAVHERPMRVRQFLKHIWPLFVAKIRHELSSEEAA